MTFKKLIIILTITVSLLITALLGTSYAWYQFDTAVTSFGDVNTYNENVGLAVIFTNSKNINTTIGMPLLETQVEDYSNKTTFTMTPNSEQINGRDIAYQISLVDIKIAEELTKIADLKYSLIETIGDGEPTEIKTGNFKNFTGDSLILKEMKTIDVENMDTVHSYEFRLWLQDNGWTLEQINCTLEQTNDSNDECSNPEYNQNLLIGKKITGKIKVSSAIK